MSGTTPRPWRQVDRGPAYDWNKWHFLQDENGAKVGRASYEDAALIVEAVNAYDRLRAIEAAARAFVEDNDVLPGASLADLRAALHPADKEAETSHE